VRPKATGDWKEKPKSAEAINPLYLKLISLILCLNLPFEK
jgi:hypothetical protein